jgi:hypothetical protein
MGLVAPGSVAVARGDAAFPARAERGTGGPGPLAGVAPAGPAAVLDGAFVLLRHGAGRLIALAALVLLPVEALLLAFDLAGGAAMGPGVLGIDGATGPGAGPLVPAAAAATALAQCLVGIAAGHLVAGWWEGRDPTLGETLRLVARRSWVAPVVVVLGAAVKLPLACLGGLGFVLGDALVFLSGVVAGAERTGPVASVARSIRLTRPAYGTALVVCLGGLVITWVLQAVLTVGPVVLLSFFPVPAGWAVVAERAGGLVQLVTVPLTACIAARAYVELRCRVEGADLLRRMQARGLG